MDGTAPEWTLEMIQDEHPDISLVALPSAYQLSSWNTYVDWEDGPDDEGDWFGRCPLHQESANAIFNFKKGVLRCDGEPSCHEGKRAMSLSNVLIRMVMRSGPNAE